MAPRSVEPPWFGRRVGVTARLTLGGAIGLVLALGACGSPSEVVPVEDRPRPCLRGTATCAERVSIAPGLYLPVHTTHLLDEGDADVTRIVVVVHGTDRNGDDYFERMVAATSAAERMDETLVIAPTFQTVDDGPRNDEPYWTSGGWKRGHRSSSSGPAPRISSYAAIDELLRSVLASGRFPAVTDVVVTGHSAGGQVAHRFAGASRIENDAGVAFRYVVANPSTYLYIGPERDGPTGFETPGGGACSDYDVWHYGLDELNSYATAVTPDSIRAQLLRRDVRILLGSADSLSASLDVTCGANLQGRNRLERGRTLIRYMDAVHPGHSHREMIVPGVGHSSAQMYRSSVGRDALFGG